MQLKSQAAGHAPIVRFQPAGRTYDRRVTVNCVNCARSDPQTSQVQKKKIYESSLYPLPTRYTGGNGDIIIPVIYVRFVDHSYSILTGKARMAWVEAAGASLPLPSPG